MDHISKNRAGQTALEYLLIVVVAIIVVVAVMVWMNAASSTASGSASKGTNEMLCRSTSCSSNDVCDATPACALSGFADCKGMQTVGSTVTPGHCEPLGLFNPLVCNSSVASTINCSTFGFGSGTVSCGRANQSFNVSACCYPQGAFTYARDKAYFNSMGGGMIPYSASGDVLSTGSNKCSTNPAACIGMKIKLLSGPAAGDYTIADFGRVNGVLRYPFVILGADFISSGSQSLSPPWNYALCGDTTPRTVIPACGNGIVEPEIGEVCDGANLNGKSCATIGRGYGAGTLSCKPNCLDWVTSGCYYYDGTVLGASDYSCCGGDIICSDYPSNCGGTCINKKLTFTGGSLSGTYVMGGGSASLGDPFPLWVNTCGTPTQIILRGFNIPACGSSRPCPAGANGAGSTYKLTD